jgi:hypothetical protein
LILENPGPACCLGLDDLEYSPAGDALLTRRVRPLEPARRNRLLYRLFSARGRDD